MQPGQQVQQVDYGYQGDAGLAGAPQGIPQGAPIGGPPVGQPGMQEQPAMQAPQGQQIMYPQL